MRKGWMRKGRMRKGRTKREVHCDGKRFQNSICDSLYCGRNPDYPVFRVKDSSLKERQGGTPVERTAFKDGNRRDIDFGSGNRTSLV